MALLLLLCGHRLPKRAFPGELLPAALAALRPWRPSAVSDPRYARFTHSYFSHHLFFLLTCKILLEVILESDFH